MRFSSAAILQWCQESVCGPLFENSAWPLLHISRSKSYLCTLRCTHFGSSLLLRVMHIYTGGGVKKAGTAVDAENVPTAVS